MIGMSQCLKSNVGQVSSSLAPACVEDQFQCWLKKKQELNENIARVCTKYADYIDTISGRVLDRKMFIKYDKMVYCIIQKVFFTFI